MNKIKIKTEYIKLDQFLKFAGIVNTGGEAKEIIRKGIVSVNSVVETQRGKKLRNNDIVEVNEKVYQIENQK